MPSKAILSLLLVASAGLPVAATLTSGSYLELRNMQDCKLYSANGHLIRTVTPQGDEPRLVAGDNRITFRCESPAHCNPRARVTITTIGNPLQ